MINKLYLEMIKLYSSDAKRIQHFTKVHAYAKLIAEMEQVDNRTLFIIQAAALTHDIGIHLAEEKYNNCSGKYQEQLGPPIAKELLARLGFDKDVSERVQYLIGHHHTYTDIDGIDYQILVEADFLVNLYEDNATTESIENAYKKYLKHLPGKYCAGKCLE